MSAGRFTTPPEEVGCGEKVRGAIVPDLVMDRFPATGVADFLKAVISLVSVDLREFPEFLPGGAIVRVLGLYPAERELALVSVEIAIHTAG